VIPFTSQASGVLSQLWGPAHGRRLQDAGGRATQEAKAETAALLVDEVLPEAPMRQWVLSFPFPLRFLFASRPAIVRIFAHCERSIAPREHLMFSTVNTDFC
jgi:hypothetical protein